MKKYVRPEILAMQGYVPGEQPRPGEAVKLNTNENPYRASSSVYDALQEVCLQGLSRYPHPLADPFRQAVSEKFGIPMESIMCGNGSDDLLTILTRTFVGAGELLRLPTPSYILYRSLAEIQGAFSEQVAFNPDWSLPNDFYTDPCPNRFDEIQKNHSDNRLRLVFLPNPNSPSGTIIPKERILEIAENLPCPLVVDEAYADFAEENCLDLVEKCEKIIVCRTLSKSYALAGLRFGYLVAAPKLVEAMLKVKDSYNCDALSIAAATAAVKDDQWLKENRQKILATRARLTKRMRKIGFNVATSHANFTWNTWPEKELKPIYQFLKQNGILVRYMDYPNWGEGLRISVGTDEQTDRCVDLIEQYLDGKK